MHLMPSCSRLMLLWKTRHTSSDDPGPSSALETSNFVDGGAPAELDAVTTFPFAMDFTAGPPGFVEDLARFNAPDGMATCGGGNEWTYVHAGATNPDFLMLDGMPTLDMNTFMPIFDFGGVENMQTVSQFEAAAAVVDDGHWHFGGGDTMPGNYDEELVDAQRASTMLAEDAATCAQSSLLFCR